LELIVLTELGGDSDVPDTGTNLLTSLIGTYTAQSQGVMGQVLDWMSRFTDIFTFSVSAPAGNTPASGSDSAEMEDGSDQEVRATDPDPFVGFAGTEDQTWVGAVAALALCHGETQRRRGRTRIAPRRGAFVEALACA
jgi:hypothetical protein